MKKRLFDRRDGARRERGQALLEFGLVAVAFLFLTFGVFDLAMGFQSWVTVQHASREAARYAITGRTDCNGEAADRRGCIEYTAKNATSGLARGGANGAAPDLIVETKAWDYTCASGACGWPEDTIVDGEIGKECDQIEVIVTYRHRFVLPVIQTMLPNGVDLVGRQRMTIEPHSPCGNGDGVIEGVP